ncbi:hypothetical protein TNCV_4133541 [Trichonephila clavipes]|uniref:Uncharacterized protein n=1 Tax=Trichonephila clavipes TaxID=2585209 RepID=A0A8X6S5D9_TRICX|nr:hypothetical protein TNCV_4133541 [Trichonephila clavipes]
MLLIFLYNLWPESSVNGPVEVAAVLAEYQRTTRGEGQYLFDLARFQMCLFPVSLTPSSNGLLWIVAVCVQNESKNKHVVQLFLAANGVVTLDQPPYSPDLAPADFFLIPRLKSALKGKKFTDITDI